MIIIIIQISITHLSYTFKSSWEVLTYKFVNHEESSCDFGSTKMHSGD